jgi:sterol desaturase/sphingolipid hydroxylase (fatty acid hydroxylase superfamily)
MHVPGFAVDLIRLGVWLALIMAVFVPLEQVFAARRQRVARAGFLTDIGWYFLSNLVPKLLLVLPVSAVAWAAHRAMPSAYYASLAGLPLWVRLAAAMVVGETGYYWAHRLMHRVPYLWRFHAIHHSAAEMDFLVNTRTHPVDSFFGRFCGLVPMYVLGLAQPMGNRMDLVPVLFALIGGLWGFFVHANVSWRFGWLEYLIATPAFHHWHHTNDGVALRGKNYASMLPWLDWWFGSFHLPASLPVTYGIDEAMAPDLAGQLLHPWTPAVPAAPAAPAACVAASAR